MDVHVSIAMATHNGAEHLAPQLESVVEQLRPADELVIVDDCSSDRTMSMLEAVSHSGVRILRNERRSGILRTFERALATTCHDIVFLCDQDDIWLPGKRDAFVAAFLHDPDCTVVVSDAQVIDGQGKLISQSFMRDRGGFRPGLWATLYRNRLLGCSMALRRKVVNLAVPIPSYVPMHDMWLGLLGGAVGRVRYLPAAYLQYRRHGRNATRSQPSNLVNMLKWRALLLIATRHRLWTRTGRVF